MEFQYPWYLVCFILIPGLQLWHKKYGQFREGTITYSSEAFFSESLKNSGRYRIAFLRFIHLFILTLIVIALARPRLVDQLQQTSVDVIDMVLVLDISSSMLADDFSPNRLEVVKQTARDFISGRRGDRVGLLVFAGQSFIQCPLTVDLDVLQNLLKEVTIAPRDYDGTAIGMAIANATNRLRHSEAESKVMILLSDGSNNAGEIEPTTAADLAAEFDIRIYTIGAGTNQSYTRIPGRGLIRNEIDEETLMEIAEKTGGKYFRATDQTALTDIYNEINQLERSEIEVKEFTSHREIYGWFLIPAFLAGLGIETARNFIFRNRT
ncbi:MAG TPA: VWA domain-containing protein [Candidatus Marinimicrobia bacterium]|nr:VWA domain-containing protein [Candidatus Neomarinimicrobiota bacterium]